MLQNRISEVKADLDTALGIQKPESSKGMSKGKKEEEKSSPNVDKVTPKEAKLTCEVTSNVNNHLVETTAHNSTEMTTPNLSTNVAHSNMDGLRDERSAVIAEETLTDAQSPKQETAAPYMTNESVQDAISDLLAVEECMTQRSINNNTMTAPPKFQVCDSNQEDNPINA